MNTHHGGLPRIPHWRLVSLSVLVLLVCLFYTYAAACLAPYPGVDFDADLIVRAFEPCEANAAWCEANQNTLQIGDQLLVIGDLSYEEPRRDRSRTPFGGHNPGDLVPITFRRTGEEQTVHWQMLGPTNASRTRRLSTSLLLYAPFWLAGTIILLFLQPRDLRWRLLVLFNHVTAIWLAVGVYSNLRVAYASPVQHALAWLLALASLHLHLAVPSPLLRRSQRYFLPPLYATAAVLASLELFQTLPGTAFYLGLFLAFLGCFGPLVFRSLAKPFVADRLEARLMLAGISLALGPGVILAIIPALLGAFLPTGLALNVVEFATPLLPFFYIYAIYKRRLGGLEFRANRLLSLYSFVALYATAFILVFSIGSQWLGLPDSPVVFSLTVSMVFIVAALPLHARFQRLIDRLAYGTEHNPDDIIRVFASRIPAGLSLEALGRLLADEVAPSLLIRQSALLLLADGSPCDGDTSIVYARGVDLGETPKTLLQVEQLLGGAGQYRPPLAETRDEFDWVRLVIPLEIREKTVGVWLFGRRDPDDYYPQDDVTLLSTLASQVAVAVENAQLAAEALRESEETYRNLVERANDGICIIQDTTVKYANARLAEMWGGTVEQVVGTPFTDYVHPDGLPKVAGRYKRRMAGEDVTPVYETVLRRKDGGKVYAELNVGVITYQGKPAELVIVRDITERKRAEEALRESEECYRAVVEDQTELICRFLPNGTLTFVNDAYCHYFGRERKELIGNSFIPLIPEEDREYVKEQFASLSLDNPAVTYEHRVILPDGQIRWQQWTDRAIFDEQGRLVEYQSVGRDSTERKWMEEAIKQRNRELSALNAVAATVNQSLDLDQVLSNALDKVLETMGLEVGAIRLLDKHSKTLDLKVYRGVKSSPQIVERISRLKLAESPLAKVVASGEPLVIEDISTHPVVELIGKRELKSLVVIPLQSKGQVLGTMEIISLDPHQFTSEEMQLLSSIGNQIGVAIHNSQLWHETNRRLQESNVLLETSQALARVLQLDDLLQLIIDSALETIESAQSGVIHLLDDATGRLYPKAMAGRFSRGTSKQTMSVGEGIAGLALEQGKVINVPDVDADPRFIELRGTHEFKSLLATPLVADGKSIGTISICSRQIRAFSREDERLMMTLAAHAAIAVKNAQLFARSEQLAMLKERNRIASEIHDSLAQNLASLLMKIDFCLGLIDSDPQATKAMLAKLKAFVRENIAEIRYSILALRHPDLEELGFLPALRKYAQAFGEQTGIPVHLSIVGEEVRSQLPAGHDYTLFRIIQESLNNVRRHARAKNVWIVVDLSAPDVVSLTVTDDGLGFDPAVQEMASLAWVDGFGLTGMKERAEALGGRLVVETEPGSGTKITAVLPIGKGG